MVVVAATIVTGFFLVNETCAQSAEEELFSTVLESCISKIRKNKDHVVVEFGGVSHAIDRDARRRIIRLVSLGKLTIVDAHPRRLCSLKRDPATGHTLDPSTGNPTKMLSIQIEKWRSETEVEVSIVFFPEPSIGCGWMFVMRKHDDSWMFGEILDNWIKMPEGFQSKIHYARQVGVTEID